MVEVIYAIVLLVSAVAPYFAYKSTRIGEGIIFAGIGTFFSWSFLTWAGSLQHGVLFWLGSGLFLINALELVLIAMSPLIKG